MRKKVVVSALVLGPLLIAALVYGRALVNDRPNSDTTPNAEPPSPPAAFERKGEAETLDPAREVVFLAPGFT